MNNPAICSGRNACSGYMTGHGVPTGFCVLNPFRTFPQADALNWARKEAGHSPKSYHLRAAINGKVVPQEDANKWLLESGHSIRYFRAREDSLYVTTSMRRSWRKRGVSPETYERFVRERQGSTWSATRANAVSWETPDETRRKFGVKLA